MSTELHTIQTAAKKQTPAGTEIELRVGMAPGSVRVRVKLPGARKWADLGDVAVVDGIATLPVPMVFVAYAKQDVNEARQLADKLWDDGFLVWMDERDLLPGDDWEQRIDDAIERSDFAVIALSSASCAKLGQFQREVKYAFGQRELRPAGHRFIIPVLLDECIPPREFRDIHWAKLWEPHGYQKLRQAMR